MDVRIENWDGYQENEFAAIAAEILLPEIGQDIVLSVPHQNTVAPVSDGEFHIFIWSSPEGQANQKPPKRIWGISVDCRDDGYPSSGRGIDIVDPETGWCVAELVDDTNLHIHHDLCHNGTDRELQIFRRLMEEVVLELSASPEEKAERLRKIREAEIAETKKAWLNECQKRFEKTLASTKKEIERADNSIKDHQRKLVEQIRILDGQRKKLEQLEASRPEAEKRYVKEFEKLHEVPHVVKVKVESGKINIFTDRIYVDHEGKTYDIGDFRIEIYTDGGNGGVRMLNLTNKLGSYDHPHVKNGSPCLGNIKETVPQLLGDYEYSVITILCVQYLQSYNPNGPYHEIENWPVKEMLNIKNLEVINV